MTLSFYHTKYPPSSNSFARKIEMEMFSDGVEKQALASCLLFQIYFFQVALKLGSSQEMKRSRLSMEGSHHHQAKKVDDELDEEEEEKAVDAEEEEEEEGGAHDTITSLAGAKMLQKYNKKLQYRGPRLAGSKPGSIHQLESLFKEEDEKPFLADVEVEEEEEEDEEEDVFVPPDGGYGWFVTLGAFISLFWTAGLVRSIISISFPDKHFNSLY